MQLFRGDKVVTEYGNGSVCYIHMAPPDFREIEAVSVLLDHRRDERSYTGTIMSINDVIRKGNNNEANNTG